MSAQVSCCNLEQWVFSAATQYAYPDQIIRGPAGTQLSVSRTYDLSTGLVISARDENQQPTSFAYDSMNRISAVTRPDNAVLRTDYDDNSAKPGVTTTTPIDVAAGTKVVQVTTYDGAGHATKQETKDVGLNSYSIVDAQYDALGRVTAVSNPHASSDSPVWTTYQYDALGRITSVTPPGNSGTYQYAYAANATTVTDPASKQRRTFTDALGRLALVHEPGYADGSPGTGNVTISGTLREKLVNPCRPPSDPCFDTIYDFGTVSITVNGFTATTYYDQGSTSTSIAAALRDVFNTTSSSPVQASASGSTVTLTSKAIGAQTNYPLSEGWT